MSVMLPDMRWIADGSRLAWLPAAVCVLGLTGCGQAGDLYLPRPEPTPPAEQSPATVPPITDQPEPAGSGGSGGPGEPNVRQDTEEGPQEDSDTQDTAEPPGANGP